ncbi:unnamed protein product [Urochloa humidicola]
MAPTHNSCKRATPTMPCPLPTARAAPPLGFVADRAEAATCMERLLVYRFRDRSLLEEALTHQSFSDSVPSYQRLEFVGDAGLGLAFSANFLYLTNPNLSPDACRRPRRPLPAAL